MAHGVQYFSVGRNAATVLDVVIAFAWLLVGIAPGQVS